LSERKAQWLDDIPDDLRNDETLLAQSYKPDEGIAEHPSQSLRRVCMQSKKGEPVGRSNEKGHASSNSVLVAARTTAVSPAIAIASPIY
jgi:hypothetical protein